MKRLLYITLWISITGLWACEKKSNWERAGDSIEDATEKIGKTAEESTDAADKASKKVKKLFK